MRPLTEFHGPALFSYGFRPFFLAATLFGLCVVPIWWLIWRGQVPLAGPFIPADWHIHEMIFGYGSAVVAGFLFTAVPNWTGGLPTRGYPLAALLSVWIAGRLAVAGLIGFGSFGVMLVDQAFLLAVATMIAREIIAGKNWRNLKVLVPVILFWIANLVFHIEVMLGGFADVGRRLGIALLIFLIMLIGGRIIPSFTRNWLARRPGVRLPIAFNRFDRMALVVSAAALLTWIALPFDLLCAALAGLAAVLQLVRLWRWRGVATVTSPLLIMLHLAYLLVPLGFLAVAAGALGVASPALAAHIFGIGAIGGMTVAVMMRATMGHTGRELVAGPVLTLAFGLLILAALLRVSEEWIDGVEFDGIAMAAVAWTAAFALLAWRLAPWLVSVKISRKAATTLTRWKGAERR